MKVPGKMFLSINNVENVILAQKICRLSSIVTVKRHFCRNVWFFDFSQTYCLSNSLLKLPNGFSVVTTINGFRWQIIHNICIYLHKIYSYCVYISILFINIQFILEKAQNLQRNNLKLGTNEIPFNSTR